jgi:hypothetical protein
MSAGRSEIVAVDPHAELERALIAEFLERRGVSLAVKELPEEDAAALLKAASLYASGRLTEMESRAHLVEDLHRAPQPPGRRGDT